MNVAAISFIAIVVLGHGAFFTYAFNRINATGLPRYIVKRIEKGILAAFGVLPILLLLVDGRTAWDAVFHDRSLFFNLTWPGKFYGIACIAAFAYLFPMWIIGRLEHWKQAVHEKNIQRDVVDMKQRIGEELFKPKWLKKLDRFPGNQIRYIELSRKEVPIVNLPKAWEGCTVAHLSDMHLTGWFDKRYTAHAIDQLVSAQPDIFCISGDLIDYAKCIDEVMELLQNVNSPLGKYFVLGNHDRRIADPEELRKRLVNEGWSDLGKTCVELGDDRRALQMLGNERPWFEFADRNIDERNLLRSDVPDNLLRIGVAHSPDQWRWGKSCQCHLLLCGHTHGGQVRVPIVGPIISPAWDGSRFASGIFRRGDQTMHVTRGLSGTQPLRIRCMPEASVLKLRIAT